MKESEPLELHVPALNELWFRQKMMSDPDTMSYNAGYDDFEGYHRDTGCIDFPESAWEEWYEHWIGREPERFYAYIRRRADGEFLGEVCCYHVPERDWYDMGIVLFAPYRGRGYAVPALRLLIDRAFRVCGVTRLHNYFEPSRISARKAHLAAGFHEIVTPEGMVSLTLTPDDLNG